MIRSKHLFYSQQQRDLRLKSILFSLIFILFSLIIQSAFAQDQKRRLAYAYEFNKGLNQCLSTVNSSCASTNIALELQNTQLFFSMLTGYEDYIIQYPLKISDYLRIQNEGLLNQQPHLLLDITLSSAQIQGDGRWLVEAQKQAQNTINLLFQKYANAQQCTLNSSCFDLLISLIKYSNYVSDGSIQKAITPLVQQLLLTQKASADLAQPTPLLSLWARAIELADVFYVQRSAFISWYISFKDGVFEEYDQHKTFVMPVKSQVFKLEIEELNAYRTKALGILKRRFSDLFDQSYQPQSQFFEYCYQQHLNHLFGLYQPNKSLFVQAPKLLSLLIQAVLAELNDWGFFEKYFVYPRLKLLDQNQELKYLSHLPQEGVVSQGMFSRLKVQAEDTLRTMYFVRPNGDELIETRIDFQRKDFLEIAYTKDMLVNYLFYPEPKNALLIGLGGGSMVYALHEYQPNLNLDIVEIDPVVMRSALDDFGLKRFKDDPLHHFYTMDGFDFFKNTAKEGFYDVIYLDAFLQPTEETDATGNPLKLKTLHFLRDIQKYLSDQGLFVINLNDHEGLSKDIATIREAFEESYLWEVPNAGNFIAVGLKHRFNGRFEDHLKKIDQLIKPSFSFRNLYQRVYPTQQKKSH